MALELNAAFNVVAKKSFTKLSYYWSHNCDKTNNGF